MEIYIVENYRDKFPDRKGKALTDGIIIWLLTSRSSYGRDAEEEGIKIQRDKLGKPRISWNMHFPAPFISVSHSRDLMACAFDSSEIGIDVQHRRDIDLERISRRCFSEEECREISEDMSGEKFYYFWTRREALCKFTGQGMQQLLAKENISDYGCLDFEYERLPDGAYLCICKKADELKDNSYEIRFSD